MLINILTNLKKMVKLLSISRFWGPVATVVFTVLYHLTAVTFGFTVAVGWLWVFAVIGAFASGRRAGLVAATWAGAYSLYAMPPADWSLTIQRILIGYILAMLAGWWTHALRVSLAETKAALAEAQAQHERADENQDKANFVDTLNGNILKLVEVIGIIDEMIDITKLARQPELTKQLVDIRVRLADLTTRAKGWHTLAKSRGFVLGEDG